MIVSDMWEVKGAPDIYDFDIGNRRFKYSLSRGYFYDVDDNSKIYKLYIGTDQTFTLYPVTLEDSDRED